MIDGSGAYTFTNDALATHGLTSAMHTRLILPRPHTIIMELKEACRQKFKLEKRFISQLGCNKVKKSRFF